MSIICTAITKSGYEMASDSHFFTGKNIYHVSDKKIFKISNLLIGCTSDSGAGILSLVEEISGNSKIKNHKDFTTLLRELISNSKLKIGDTWEILLNDGISIYHISPFSTLKYSAPFAAIGAGKDFAVGAMSGLARHQEGLHNVDSGICQKAVDIVKNYSTNAGGDTQFIHFLH
ncbi:MAG: hypothetical protein PHW73_00585 [Atribacterota bacterium]|nr:hypothetical protein [Atribacterota bacterium]